VGGSRGRGAVPRERAGGPAPRPYVCVLAVPRGENWSILVASFSSVRALFSHAPPPLNNRALQIAHAKKLIADAAKKQKAAYGNMFSKISVYDDKAAPVMPGTNPNNPKVGPLLWHMLPDDLFSCLSFLACPRGQVFFDVTIGGKAVGRLVMVLYHDIVPKVRPSPSKCLISSCTPDRPPCDASFLPFFVFRRRRWPTFCRCARGTRRRPRRRATRCTTRAAASTASSRTS